MCFHRSSAREQRVYRVSPLKAALRGGGMGEDGMLLACIQHKRSGARWRRSTPLSLYVPVAGEYLMSVIRRIPFVLALSLVVSTSLFGLAARPAAAGWARAPAG